MSRNAGAFFPRVRWRPRISFLGIASGVAGGAGALVLLQQFAVLYPTRTMSILVIAAGPVAGLVLSNAGRARAVGKLNRRLFVAEAALAHRFPQGPQTSAPAAPAPVTAADGWAPTHVVPAAGLQCWENPDPTLPVTANLGAATEVQVVETRGAWSRVVCSNGWSAWVDGRLLEVIPR